MKNIAIIGCGSIAKTHGLCVQDLGYELVAVTSRTRSSAEKYAENYPTLRADWLTDPDWMANTARQKLLKMFKAPRVCPDIESMNTCGKLDAVIIASTPPSHCQLLETIVRTLDVKAILCEKPMAMSAVECRRMIDACKEKKIRFAVYQDLQLCRRHFIEARRLLDQNQIGKLEFIRGVSNPSLFMSGIYAWAAIVHLTRSGVQRVEAFLDIGDKQGDECLQENTATVHFHLENGVQGVLLTNQPDPRGSYLRFDGSEGSLEISFLKTPSLRIWQSGSTSWVTVTPPSKGYDGHRSLLEGIVTDDPAFRDFNGESALKSTLPVFAAWQSNQEKRSIDLVNEKITFQMNAELKIEKS